MTTTAAATTVSESAFRVEYMQPFVDSLLHFFTTHLGVELKFGKPGLNETRKPPYEMAGVITFSGTVVGRAVISLSPAVAETVCAAYLRMDPLPDGVVDDCVGEIANVIVGRAKSNLTKHQIMISPPTVVKGKDFLIAPQRDAACISVPCESELGALQLDISLVLPG